MAIHSLYHTIMKKKILASLALMLTVIYGMGATKPAIDRIDPPYWWTGMHQDTLQLMVSGPDISRATPDVNHPGVSLAQAVRLDSPDYLLLYLVVGDDAQPGVMNLSFKDGNKKTDVKYELRQRVRPGDANPGFDSSDVLYLVMPDRFAKGANHNPKGLEYTVAENRGNPGGRHGGDIAGLRRHLGYIDSLGVTAVWLNPVLENDMPGGSYHGYATTDYYSIDPRLGSNGEWRDFIADAHSRGLKVVMDMIFNHCGSNHPWLKNRPSKDWFNHPEGFVQTNFRLNTVSDPYASDYDLDQTVNGWFVETMPDLNQRNPHLLKYLIQNSIWWIEDSQIDGIRMDTHPYADFNGMSAWIKAVKDEYPNFNIVGECWLNQEGGPAFWQSGSKINRLGDTNLPTVMDFPMQQMIRDAFTTDGGLNKIYEHLGLDYMFADPSHVLTFLDNHDTPRFLLEQPADLGSWKQAMAFLLTTRGIPQLYYGDEILMSGDTKQTDGNVRRDFPGGFPGDAVNAFTADGRTAMQNEAHDFLAKLLNWRKGNDAVRFGTLKHFIPQDGVYVYQRKSADGKDVVVILNGNDRSATMNMAQVAEALPLGAVRRDMLSEKLVTVSEAMTFTPRQILILE